MRRVDVAALIDRIDVDRVLDRVDVVARSTAGVVGGTLDLLRSVGVGLDLFVHRWVARLLRRDASSPPPGPHGLVEPTEAAAA